MNVSSLLDHLSLFENLISLPPGELVNVLNPYISQLTSIGRFFILLLFILNLTKKIVTMPFKQLMQTIFSDIYCLVILMVIFGNSLIYGALTSICINIFDHFSKNAFQSEIVQFKGSFRTLIDTIADQSKMGVDFLNIKAASSSIITLFLSFGTIILLISYYVFVSVGMFELLIILASGPILAGFYFLFKYPFYKWIYAIFACLIFPIISSISIVIINQSNLLVNLEDHLITGSLVTVLLQISIAVIFFDITLVFHASFFGVSFMNIPIIIKTGFMTLFGHFHATWLNLGILVATRRRG